MKRHAQNVTKQGSITVFLSLILLLILSLLFTIIEGARISTARIFAERSFTTAMDSVLAEFYGPLWKEYHVFALEAGYGSAQVQEEDMALQLQDYMSYTLMPNRGMNTTGMKEGLELYDISLESISITDKIMLTDYQGKLLINQAVEYMKYKELGDVVGMLLDKMSLLESPKKVSILFEEKQKALEELVVIDEGILELMELLDGVKTSKKGIKVGKNGALKTSPYYVKKICFATVTKKEVGINQESIFLSLKDSYVNPKLDFTMIKEGLLRLDETRDKLEENYIQLNMVISSLTAANKTLDELNKITTKSEAVKKQIAEEERVVSNLSTQKDKLQKECEEYEAMKHAYITDIHRKKKELLVLISEIKPKTVNAMNTIDIILERMKRAEPLIKSYEESLYKEKEEIGEVIFASMEEDFNELKRYSKEDVKSYDFVGMRQSLEANLAVLAQTEHLLEQGEQELTLENYNNAREAFQTAENVLSSYHTKKLNLDYSTLVLNKNEELSPLGMAGSVVQDAILGLVIDPNTVSKAELTAELLPSMIEAMAAEEGGFLFNISSFFKNSVVGDRNSGMSGLFGSFGTDSEAVTQIGVGFNTVAEHFLFQEYLREHFYMFSEEGENTKAKKPSALSYEQEYLLVGKITDKENLSSVISRIIFLRTILDFVSILGDRDKCNEAKAVAASLVGFTGLPILVSITKTLILLVWSFFEALVDMSAMLMGKDVPILKKRVVLSFPELFLMNRSFIQKKASEIEAQGELSFSYQDYLRIFLLLKNKKDLAYLVMDLIQENLRLRYLGTFYFSNFLFGFNAETSVLIDTKFIGISFVQKQLGAGSQGFQYKMKASYSY